MDKKVSSESVVKDIRRRTRKKYSSEEKIRIVLDGLRGEDSISSLCPKKPKARTFWNKIPDEVKEQIVQQALEQVELSPRELATRIYDTYLIQQLKLDWKNETISPGNIVLD